MPLLFPNGSLGARLHAQNKLQQRPLHLQDKLHRSSGRSLPRQPKVREERQMQLDARIEILHSFDSLHHTWWLRCGQILLRPLAGRNREAFQLWRTRSLGHRRCNFDFNWILGNVRWKFAVVIKLKVVKAKKIFFYRWKLKKFKENLNWRSNPVLRVSWIALRKFFFISKLVIYKMLRRGLEASNSWFQLKSTRF